MDIILYGLGKGRKLVEQCLNPEHRIIAYSDSFARIEHFGRQRFITADKLGRYKFDYLILCIPSVKTAESVSKELQMKQGIPKEKIFNFYDIYHRGIKPQKVDRVLSHGSEKYNGIVLGISHAVCGIRPHFFRGGVFCNLAVRGQDIYYNCRTLEWCMQYYKERFDNLNCIIFEMYDYNYFNYDVSLLKNAINFYYSKGGIIEDEHNFSKNKFFERPLKEELGIMPLCEEEIKIRDELFADIYRYSPETFCDVPLEGEFANIISADAPLPARKFCSDILIKRFEDTIQENKVIFENFLIKLKKINPEMRIICILIPRFWTMELALKSILQPWKKEFEETMCSMKNKYGLEYYDFKSMTEISENRYFYNDVNHLNDVGAIAFTSMLNNKLFPE